jgi:hypothetical protein
MLRTCTIAAVIAASILVAGWSDAALTRHIEHNQEADELVYVPPAKFLEATSIGYRRALADALWFRTISYFGRHYRRDRVYPWLAYMCDVVTDLDPSAEHVYRFCGVILPWEADLAQAGISLLEKGVRNVPASWYLRYVLGFSHYFFENDLAAASRVLEQAMRIPDAPAMIGRLAALVHAAEYGTASALDFLAELDRSNPDEQLRQVIRERMRELTFTARIDQLNAAVRAFRARFGRPPVALVELVASGIVKRLPLDPFGGEYVLDPVSGEVHNSLGQEPVRLGSSPIRKMVLQGRRRAG